ncbi:MAG: hypothetical protein RM347_025435 [Nostoc sp. ChiQUE02]|uniref:hypothetical protein n=1 Tax=Nostoc sp. ChiQUE02 TaxID=3075377 RepID=UPI002AD32F62|nr:hypothetical protein [Nostoc sp. ChiQUE02]MDZ8234144.1 hypothetical protein [Nostoc sp. ChiQUE02]
MANTYNPIVSKEALRWGLLQRRPVPEPGTALVFVGDGQPLLTITQGQRGPTKGEMVWGKYNMLYKVDISEHPLSFRCDLPCKTDAFDFHAEVKFNCSVHEPEIIVQRNVTDVYEVLEPLIDHVMRSMSRSYEFKEVGIAEREIGDRVKQEVYDAGFQLNRFVLKLSLEQEVRDRIRRKTNIQEEVEVDITSIKGKSELEKTVIEEQNKLEKLKIESDKLEIERLRIKMDFYNEIIQTGSLQLLVLQLAKNPNDVMAVAQMLNQQRQLAVDNEVKLLEVLLKEDAIEGSQFDDAGKHIVQRLMGLIERPAPALKSNPISNPENKKPLAEKDETNNSAESVVPEFNWEEDEEDN